MFAKLNAAELLRREFARPAYQPQTIVLGANTDPYQPIEHHYRLTRQLLEVMLAHRHPVGIITKSAMILRDLDLLTELASEGLCQVMVSVTTLNETLRRQLEPRASTGATGSRWWRNWPAPACRSVLAAPMIRGSTSPSSSRSSKALPRPEPIAPTISCCDCPTSWHRCSVTGLMSTIPARRRRSNQLRASRDGALNSPAFGSRMRGEGQFADLLAQRFRLIAKRLGLGKRHFQLRQDAFIRQGEQLRLF